MTGHVKTQSAASSVTVQVDIKEGTVKPVSNCRTVLVCGKHGDDDFIGGNL